MSSEKSRYLKRDREPIRPMDFNELLERLPSLGVNRLAEMLWSRAQEDDVLSKVTMVSVALRTAGDDLKKAITAVEYALHFPSYVRYTEKGHGQILHEIKSELEYLTQHGQSKFALEVARHAVELGQWVAGNFEDDFDWVSSLKVLSEWVEEVEAAVH